MVLKGHYSNEPFIYLNLSNFIVIKVKHTVMGNGEWDISIKHYQKTRNFFNGTDFNFPYNTTAYYKVWISYDIQHIQVSYSLAYFTKNVRDIYFFYGYL